MLQSSAGGAQLTQQIADLGIEGRQHLGSPASRYVAATHTGRRGDPGDRLTGNPALQEFTLAGIEGAGHAGASEAQHRLDRPALGECPVCELGPAQRLEVSILGERRLRELPG